MIYVTAAELIERFSAEELAQRAAPEGVRVVGALFALTVSGGDRDEYSESEIAAADAALVRVQEVIADGQALIDGYVGARLTLPLATTPRLLKQLAGDVFRYLIYDDQLEADGIVERRYKNAIKLLTEIRDGRLDLGAAVEDEAGSAADSAEVRAPARIFSRDTLAGY